MKYGYFKGDKGIYTGNVIVIHGGTFYEIEMLEGLDKGKKKVTKNPPEFFTNINTVEG